MRWGKLQEVPDVLTIRAMNPRQERFVLEYCKDLNATQAAIRAGYSAKTAGQIGDRLLKNVEIRLSVDEKLGTIAKRAEITVEAVLQRWWDIATADPNELMQLRRQCCRYCHGALHAYQWTEAEYAAQVDKAIDSGKPPPDGLGGFGFDANLPPHPRCPECAGNGTEDVFCKDTRNLKGPAALLYAGAKRTRNGIEIMVHDQAAALERIARYLGMSKERVDLVHVQAKSLDDFYAHNAKPDAA